MEDLRPQVNKNIIIIGAAGVLLLLILITVVVSQFRSGGGGNTQQQTQQTQNTSNPSTGGAAQPNTQNTVQEEEKSPPPAPGVVATVGEEYIYQSDLDDIMSVYPPAMRNSSEGRKAALQKLIDDSITLQAGAADRIITLADTFYNSSQKDRTLRNQQIDRVRTVVESNTGSISGAVFSIWFFNNGEPGRAGYEQGKQIASQKITQYRQMMISERLSPDALADRMKADTSLEALDFIYKQNVIFTFEDVGAADSITFDETFNQQIRKLKPNQVGNVYLAKAPGLDGKQRDAVYMFAYVTENEAADQKYGSMEEWLQLKRTSYEVTTY